MADLLGYLRALLLCDGLAVLLGHKVGHVTRHRLALLPGHLLALLPGNWLSLLPGHLLALLPQHPAVNLVLDGVLGIVLQISSVRSEQRCSGTLVVTAFCTCLAPLPGHCLAFLVRDKAGHGILDIHADLPGDGLAHTVTGRVMHSFFVSNSVNWRGTSMHS